MKKARYEGIERLSKATIRLCRAAVSVAAVVWVLRALFWHKF